MNSQLTSQHAYISAKACQSFSIATLSVEAAFDIQIHYYLAMNMEGIHDNVEYHGIDMETQILIESDILAYLLKILSE